jgi:hypothetical protein
MLVPREAVPAPGFSPPHPRARPGATLGGNRKAALYSYCPHTSGNTAMLTANLLFKML